MSFSDWSNEKKKKQSQGQTAETQTARQQTSGVTAGSADTFTQWSNRKKNGTTITGYNDKEAISGWNAYQAAKNAREQQEEDKTWFEKLAGYLGGVSDTTMPTAEMSRVTESYREDTTYREPRKDWTLQQMKEFGFLYQRNPQEAWEYAEQLNNSIDAAQNEEQREQIRQDATGSAMGGALHTAGALLTAPLGLADYLNEIAEYSARGKVTEHGGLTPAEYSQAVTGGVAEHLNEQHGTLDERIPVIGGKGWGDVYGLATSIMQSSLAGKTGGQLGALVQFFGSAAASGVQEAKNRGASDEQALLLGTLQGLAEGLAEQAGIDNLMKVGASHTWKEFAVNLLKQGGAEGLEEGLTTLMNNISEQIVMQGDSVFYTLVDNYIADGMNPEEAKKQAWLDMVNDIAFDMLGGFLSGAVHAGPQTAAETYRTGREMRTTYGEYQQELVEEGMESAEGTDTRKVAERLQDKLNAGRDLSGSDLYRIVDANTQTAAAERLTELGETGDVQALSRAIAAQTIGRELTGKERRMIARSQNAQTVLREFKTGQVAEQAAEAPMEAQKPEKEVPVQTVVREEQPVQEAKAEPVEEPAATVLENRTVSKPETAPASGQQVTGKLTAEDSTEVQAEQTIEQAARSYGAQAGAMLHTYHQGQDVAKYDQAYRAAFDMGRSGVSLNYVKNSPITAYLTDGQKELAHKAGAAAAKSEAEKLEQENKAAANGKQGRKQGTVKGDGVTVKDLTDAFNDTQGMAYRYLADIAKVTGVDIVLYRSESGEAWGKYDRDDPGTVYIDLNSGIRDVKDVNQLHRYMMLRTFSHEFTHFIEKWNPVQYNEFRKVVFDTMESRGEDVNRLIELKQTEGMGYEEASREVVAEAMTDILPDSSFAQTLAEKNKSIFQWFLDKLTEFVDNLKTYFRTIRGGEDAGARALKQQVGDTVKYLDEIVQMYDRIAVEAVETYQQTVEEVAVSETENTTETKPAETETEDTVSGTEESVIESSKVVSEVGKVASEDASLDASPASATEEYRSEHGYTIRPNDQYGSLEITFDGKPSQGVRDALKANKFRWNRKSGVWYGYTDRKTITDALNKAYEAESTEPEESDFAKAFRQASQEERDEVVEAIRENTNISHVMPSEIRESAPSPAQEADTTEEVMNNGEESENGTDTGAVPEPVRGGEAPARLLEGVEPEPVSGSGAGRQPVSAGSDQGAGDAGRDRRADAAGAVPERGAGDRLAGDLQQLPAVTEAATDNNVGGNEDQSLSETVAQEIRHKSTVNPKGSNFMIGESLNLPSGTKARVRANIDAIKLVKKIAAEDRIATPEEQEVLSKYVGWGGLADAFGKPVSNYTTRKIEYQAVSGLETEFEELKSVLTEEEYKSARESTKNAHYTSIEVIKAMYDGLKGLGFQGGRMLEPSSGVGNFVGAMPADMTSSVKSWTMVELDSITGLFAKYLYPNADVRIQGFEQTNIPDGYMDVAIGNVPFGNYGIADKHYPKTVTTAIHNYFFAKALDKVRPGGIVMFITSSYTMNSSDSAVRKYIMQRADLLGAIRLPDTAFKGNAGTEVVTDILVLKKRESNTVYSGEAFAEAPYTRPVEGNWSGAYINEYFNNHPEMVLGTPSFTGGMYRGDSLTYKALEGKGSLADQIRQAFSHISGKMEYPAQLSPEKANYRQANAKKRAQRLQVKDGIIQSRDENGNVTRVDVDKDTADRIVGMVAIRDAHTALCDALQQGVNKKSSNALRKALNKAYDSFVEKYGYLNSPKNKRAINSFADRYAILSLENYSSDGKKVTVTKSDIFSRDTIAPNRTAQSADTVEEGLTVSLNTEGRVNTELIAKLTGQQEDSVRRQLIDQRLVFKDKDGNLIPSVQYLSGNVRAKLREMEGLVGIDPDYRNNVEALREVVPPTIPHTDIYVNPGANWVPVSVYEDFVGHILNRTNHTAYRTGRKDFSVEYVAETNEYKVSINDVYAKSSAQNTQVWGESGKTFSTIFENILNGRRTNVYTDAGDGKRVIDKAKTEAVAEKAEKLSEEFRNWLWAEETRRSEMQELYNETYNALVTPKYSGESLTVNGLNAEYILRPHQKDAVARIINSGGNTLLAHRVGAGKTMEMAAAAMKLKQLGIIKKPMFVVPNNVVAQWGKEFKDYFPAANILMVGDEDMTPAERMTTINRIKNNDYDAVILAYTKFEKIQMTSAWRQRFYEEQIDGLLFAINAEKESQGGKGFTVKQLENKRKQLENRMKKLTEKAKDEDGAMFEDLGVDALFVDEAHNFKNLEYSTRMNNVSGLGKADGSQRAFDLYTKVRYLQHMNGGRGVVFATATPVMNSMTEMYIMQKYLQPDTLKQLGIEHFDSWAKMFGEVVNALEIAPSGSGYRLKQTFSKFKNVKALQQLFRSFTDVLTDVPGLKIPKMKGRRVQIVECEQGEFQKNYMADLAKRAENVRNVDPTEDNMLKITSDGRKISYSQRMIEPTLPYEESGKIYKCCDNVARVYKESGKTKGTQMIFCDMATPKGKSNTKAEGDTNTEEFASVDVESAQLYDDIKNRLVQLGIPAKEIAFIHDAKNDKQKAQLSEKMNNGTIRVLIGSTGKMGVGLNAQKKAVAIHHLDAPWRPGDIEQRDGRVFRQKNENEEAYKFVYVTKGSFDSRLWDILERKQNFINQVMNGEDVGNEIEDTGEVTLSAAEVKAVASNNPLIMEQVALEKEISKLQSLQQAHTANVRKAEEKIIADRRNIARLENLIANGQADIHGRKDTYSSEKVFSIRIGSRTYTDKKDAAAALVTESQAKAKEGEYTDIGSFAGFTLRVVKTSEGVKGQIAGAGTYEFKTYPMNPGYGINHLISVVEGIDERLNHWNRNLSETRSDLQTQQQIAGEPFDQAEKLKQKRSRYNEVMDILNPPVEQQVDEDAVQEQKPSEALTDRDVLMMAAEELDTGDWTAAERDALDVFRKRLSKLEDLQSQRAEQGRLYREQQFGTNVNRAEAEKTRNRMQELDRQIRKAGNDVLDVEDKGVLKQVLQKARKVVEAEERKRGDEKLSRWRDRRNNAEAIRKYRERISKDVKALTDWVIHPDNKSAVKHIPDAVKTTVIPFLRSIDFTSKRQLKGGEATQADKTFMERLRKLEAAMANSEGAEDIYAGFTDLPPDFMEKLHGFVSDAGALVESSTGSEFVINQMTAKELKDLSDIVRDLKMHITNMNKFHVNAMFKHVYDAGDNSIDFLSGMKPAKHTGGISQYVLWQQMRPAYAFERFGKGGEAVYDGLRRGQATLAFNTRKIQEFAQKAYTAGEVKAWEKQLKTIKLASGEKITMKVSQIMSLYELYKRDQAKGHILGDGIRAATFKDAKGKKLSDTGHLLTPEDLNAMFSTLSKRQIEVADKLQKYMQETGGAWGNEVTMARFGEKQFGEENYFPINSDGRHLDVTAEENPKSASLYALLNMGFTKQTQEKARNRIVVYSIFDVFANHMASMAQYNAFALPVVDALKWFNYKVINYTSMDTMPSDWEKNYSKYYVKAGESYKKLTGEKPPVFEAGKYYNRVLAGSVRDEMDRVYGTPEESRPGSGKRGYAQNFIINIIKAFNGTEAQGTPYDSWGIQTLHRYNRAQVAYNLRVVVQQPLAITRAAQLIDYGSIMKGLKLKPEIVQKNIAEMRRYSGIAAWKSLGFYDVNISRGLTALIKHDETVMDKVTDFGMDWAEKADEWTWAAIWSACKIEVMTKQKLTPKNEGFYEAVTKLFEDVIYKTQVVDSVLTKNEFMRDKGSFARAVGSFMSEPTTTASMLADAYDKFQMDMQRGMSRQQAWKKNQGNIVRTAYVYGVGAVVLAAVQAVADAFRDDDDYQDLLEKWVEAFGGNLLDEAMPLNKLPIASDIWELMKELLSIMGVDTYGNPPKSVFMQWYDSLVKGVEIIYGKITGTEDRYTWYGGVYKLLQTASGIFGVPMAAFTRELVTAWNNTVGAMAPSLKVKTYDSGEKNEIKYAWQDGWLTDEEAMQELQDKGVAKDEDEAYWTMRGWETGGSRYDALYDAVLNGGDYASALKEMTDHGYTEKEVRSQLKSQIGQWYQDGEITKQQTISMLNRYIGMDTEDITATVNKWSSKVVTGIAWNDIKDEYLTGRISQQRAIEMYVRYGGYTTEDATWTVKVWDWQDQGYERASRAMVQAYEEQIQSAGIGKKVYYDAYLFYQNSGEEDVAYSKVKECMPYIDSLPLTDEQKTALALSWWAESTVRRYKTW